MDYGLIELTLLFWGVHVGRARQGHAHLIFYMTYMLTNHVSLEEKQSN